MVLDLKKRPVSEKVFCLLLFNCLTLCTLIKCCEICVVEIVGISPVCV